MTKSKPEKPSKPYGFVLVLRGLASAAIRLYDRPAALRVLCVAAEYMNQDGVCKISQDTIAARLDMTRQGVNKHLAWLDKMEILCGAASRDGILKSYYLDMDGLEDGRFGQDRVDARRKAKREAKKGAFNPDRIHAVQPAPHEKAGQPIEPEREVTGARAPVDEPPIRTEIRAGDLVSHPKLGVGKVDEYYAGGSTALVHFAKVGRTVVISFLTLCNGEGATQ